jgi:Yip1 domain
MNLIERVKNILVKPKEEWLVINTESHSGLSLIMSYLLPLAILSAAATFVGYAFLSRFGSIKIGLIYGLIALAQTVLAVYITPFVTDALAPSFGSEKSLNKSTQLIVYAATPVYIGGLLNLIPGIGWLGLLAGGIYSIYLLYLGLPVLKKTPEDKVPVYLIIIILVLAVIYWLIGYILLRIFWSIIFGGHIVPLNI